MFTFISFWRTAAIVLCDMSSTFYYVGAIVENAIGKAAPWFILAVPLFRYAMRAVYIESCALFVRGGVYRIVIEALGGFCACHPARGRWLIRSNIGQHIMRGRTKDQAAPVSAEGLYRLKHEISKTNPHFPTLLCFNFRTPCDGESFRRRSLC